MAEQNKFGQKPEGLRCEDWEALLADALDGLLPAHQSAAFTAHTETCAACADLLAHAEQGREWLGFLHTEPEVPARLLEKILDKTAGAGIIPLEVIAGAPVAGVSAAALPVQRSFQETRLMMTVAMAFFSTALMLNLIGFKLTNFRLADLRPSVISSTLSRQFYGARGSVVRYYQNLRFVYQLESRMRELRRDVETPQPPGQTQQNQHPQQKNGQSKTEEEGSILRARSSERGSAQHAQDPTLGTTEAKETEPPSRGAHENRTEITTLAQTEVPFSPDSTAGHSTAGQQQNSAEHDGRSLA